MRRSKIRIEKWQKIIISKKENSYDYIVRAIAEQNKNSRTSNPDPSRSSYMVDGGIDMVKMRLGEKVLEIERG